MAVTCMTARSQATETDPTARDRADEWRSGAFERTESTFPRIRWPADHLERPLSRQDWAARARPRVERVRARAAGVRRPGSSPAHRPASDPVWPASPATGRDGRALRRRAGGRDPADAFRRRRTGPHGGPRTAAGAVEDRARCGPPGPARGGPRTGPARPPPHGGTRAEASAFHRRARSPRSFTGGHGHGWPVRRCDGSSPDQGEGRPQAPLNGVREGTNGANIDVNIRNISGPGTGSVPARPRRQSSGSAVVSLITSSAKLERTSRTPGALSRRSMTNREKWARSRTCTRIR